MGDAARDGDQPQGGAFVAVAGGLRRGVVGHGDGLGGEGIAGVGGLVASWRGWRATPCRAFRWGILPAQRRLDLAHPAFKNPPIVEAVVALRFSGGETWTEAQRASMIAALTVEYAGPAEEQFEHQFELQVQGSQSRTAQSMKPARVLLRTEDRSALAAVGAGAVSVHVLRPYPGWDVLLGRVERAVAVVLAHSGSVALSEVTVRYIDRIAVPSTSTLPLAEYFPAIPPRPAAMPVALTGFHCTTASSDDEASARLTLAAVTPQEGEQFVMLYDLQLSKAFAGDVPLAVDRLREVLDVLHDRQYEIFMQSITAHTQELFQ